MSVTPLARTSRADAPHFSVFGALGVVTRPARWVGMTDTRNVLLPHQRLDAYRCALELLRIVRHAKIRDAKLRDQALRAAKSAALNIAEASGRTSPADRARVFAIARGEAMEAAAALEIGALSGDASAASYEECLPIASRLAAMLGALSR